MTVSPQWPQDGNRQPKGVANGVESDDSDCSPALPPTLFKLPNLNPVPQYAPDSDGPPRTPAPQTPAQAALETTTSTQTEAVASSNPSAASENSQVLEFETRQAAVPDSSQAAAPETLEAAAPETLEATAPETLKATAPETLKAVARQTLKAVARQTSKVVARQTSKPAESKRTSSSACAPVSSDQPAGRSWMEKIGSHGVVVVLLLVVVTAALVSGRNSGDRETDASLAESDELLDFSEGTDIDLPLPEHRSNESSGFASSVDVESSTPAHDPSLSALESEVSVNSMTAAAGVEPTATSNPTSNSFVSPDASDPSFQATIETSPSEFSSGGLEVNRFESSRFSSVSASVDALPVSSRFPIESGASTLPTLEDLADEPTSTRANNMVQPTAPSRLLSRTPAGINDWSRYLPAYESAPVAGSEIPSTSK